MAFTAGSARAGAHTTAGSDTIQELTVEELRAKYGTRMEIEDPEEHMLLSMGPQHPSTHGVLRLLVELDGETVVNLAPDIGFLHTGIEKNMEAKTYTKALVMTDRMDYLAPMSNNLCYILAVEKLLGIEATPRAQAIRVILTELTRVQSHLVWLGTHALDLAAMTVFLYCFREREYLLDIFEMVAGQRMMVSYFRPGGLWRDLPQEFEPAVRQFLDFFPARIADYEALLKNNPIFLQRTKGIGVVSAEDAVAWGLTGPSLRASGVEWDIRKARPYQGYEQYEFDVPVETDGDVYARYLCRMQEMRESLRIIEQALDNLPDGPINIDDRKIVPPPRAELGRSMEAVIHHFKLWTEGFSAPEGYVYQSVESPRGESGCYLRGDGSPKPARVHFRTPSFVNLASLPHMAKGQFVADLVAVIGSIDIVLGEIDR
jgi:NADH-quinone oxidoreductase subunit D